MELSNQGVSKAALRWAETWKFNSGPSNNADMHRLRRDGPQAQPALGRYHVHQGGGQQESVRCAL